MLTSIGLFDTIQAFISYDFTLILRQVDLK